MIWYDMIWYDMIWYDMIWYDMIWYDMIYLLIAIWYPPGGSSTVHIYTQTIHRTTQSRQYIEQHKNFGRVRAVPRLCGFYPGVCLTAEEKARKNLSQGSRRVPAGTMKIHKHIIRIHRHNNMSPFAPKLPKFLLERKMLRNNLQKKVNNVHFIQYTFSSSLTCFEIIK